ncbi:hypothetical protein CALVIDRAFT_563427 [Calocera viscosa TUFC12733]|uniref:F-box domain-containing protein n=1 Tax=Calocera viscosa (strain TUFC12733) TaxID=1330018 RepID=A0A167MJ98_CALVF|nr:hypothetical protein CALVIDRAFT_563427 [Calocera viscosa TUFC12733]
MHALFHIPELLSHLLSFLASSPVSLRRLALTCRLCWEPCTALLYADQSTPRARESLRTLELLYLDTSPSHLPNEEVYSRRLAIYAPFVREIIGTLPPRSTKERGALPWPAYRGLETLLTQWPADPPGVGPLFSGLRRVKLGLEGEAALLRLGLYLAPGLRELELVLGEEVGNPSLERALAALPSQCPQLEVFALETLVASHRPIQDSLALLLPKLKELHSLRLRVTVGPALLSALERIDLRTLTLYLFDAPSLSLPLHLPRLASLHLYGPAPTCTSLLLSLLPTNTSLHTLKLHLTGFSPSSTTALCAAAAVASPTLEQLELRSLAARTQGAPQRTLSPTHFSPLHACTHLTHATFIGGWQGRDRILWRSQDILALSLAWQQVRVLNLVSQSWHGHRFDPLCTLEDLLPLALNCRSLCKLSIALDMRSSPSLPTSLKPATALRTLSLAAYSLPPSTELAELEAGRWVRKVWPRARLVVDPDSTNSPGELERWVEGLGVERMWEEERGRLGGA